MRGETEIWSKAWNGENGKDCAVRGSKVLITNFYHFRRMLLEDFKQRKDMFRSEKCHHTYRTLVI